MLRVSVVLLSVLCVAFAVELIGLPKPIPEKFRNVPGCYIRHLNQVIQPGEAITDHNGCTQILCKEDRIIYFSCPVIDSNRSMKLVEDKSNHFPLLPKKKIEE